MADYIKRETLVEKVCSITLNIFGIRMGKTILYQVLDAYRKAVLTTIEEAPAADVVEVRHGEWIVDAWDGEKDITIPYQKHEHTDPYCSICKSHALLDGAEFGVASNYCPNCGAKMDGERKE